MTSRKDRGEHFLPFENLEEYPMPSSSSVTVEFGAVTDTGKVREKNEDAFLIYRTGRFWEKLHTNLHPDLLGDRHEENAYAMAVADGMGGLSAGEVASRTALVTIVNMTLSSVKWSLKMDDPETRSQEILEGIERAIGYLTQADVTLSRQAKMEGAPKGIGTTLTGTYSYANDLFIFHVGDSRAYLFRNKKLFQITRDHTVAQMLADSGVIQQSEVENHHFKHLLTRAVGLHEGKVDVEIHHLNLLDGDSILLCSDGLTDMVADKDIEKVLKSSENAQQKCDALLEHALNAGGKDNITVVIGQYSIPA